MRVEFRTIVLMLYFGIILAGLGYIAVIDGANNVKINNAQMAYK